MLYAADAFYSFHSVLLVGYGIVGRSCRMALEGRFCQLEAYDTDSRVLEVAEKDGLRIYSHPDPAMFFRVPLSLAAWRPSFGEELFRPSSKDRGTISI